MATVVLTEFQAQGVIVATYQPNVAALQAAGYTGSLSDMRRQNFLELLALAPTDTRSNNDLESAYWLSVGRTGSIQDARHQP